MRVIPSGVAVAALGAVLSLATPVAAQRALPPDTVLTRERAAAILQLDPAGAARAGIDRGGAGHRAAAVGDRVADVLLAHLAATSSALLGGVYGLVIDGRFSTVSTAGYFGGGVLGATAVASLRAARRGCPARRAYRRAALGALAGALPGIIAAAPRGPTRSGTGLVLVYAAPAFSGLSATAAVAGCRAP